MALKKLVQLDNGLTADYFRIDLIAIREGQVSAMVGLYTNEAAAKVQKHRPVESIEVILSSGSFTKKLFVDGDPYEIIYEKIKQISQRDPQVGHYGVTSTRLFGNFLDA